MNIWKKISYEEKNKFLVKNGVFCAGKSWGGFQVDILDNS